MEKGFSNPTRSSAPKTLVCGETVHIRSDRVMARLRELERRAPHNEELRQAALKLSQSDSLQEKLSRALLENPGSVNSVEALYRFTGDTSPSSESSPNWWSRNVEQPAEDFSVWVRKYARGGEKTSLDIQFGILRGGYAFSRDLLLSLWNLLKLCWDLLSDSSVRAKVKAGGARLLRLGKRYVVGTDRQREIYRQKMETLTRELLESIYDDFARQWEEASRENREVELAAKWCTQGVIEVATLAIAWTKGARAAKGVAEAAEGASAELGHLARVQQRKLNRIIDRVEKLEVVAEERLKARKYIPRAVSKKVVHRRIGRVATKLLKQTSPKVRQKIEQSLGQFLYSFSYRNHRVHEGLLGFSKQDYERFVRDAIKVLEDVERGKEVTIYRVVRMGPTPGSTQYWQGTKNFGFKPQKFVEFAQENGFVNRLGPGVYAALSPETAIAEMGGALDETQRMVRAVFTPPKKLDGDFWIFPSVRNKKLNIVDLDLSEPRVFSKLELLDSIPVLETP